MQNTYKRIFLKNLGVFILINALSSSDGFNAIKYCFKSMMIIYSMLAIGESPI